MKRFATVAMILSALWSTAAGYNQYILQMEENTPVAAGFCLVRLLPGPNRGPNWSGVLSGLGGTGATEVKVILRKGLVASLKSGGEVELSGVKIGLVQEYEAAGNYLIPLGEWVDGHSSPDRRNMLSVSKSGQKKDQWLSINDKLAGQLRGVLKNVSSQSGFYTITTSPSIGQPGYLQIWNVTETALREKHAITLMQVFQNKQGMTGADALALLAKEYDGVIGKAQVDGKEQFFALMSFGKKKTLYAMMGIWEDNVKAAKYGFRAGEPVYPSRTEPSGCTFDGFEEGRTDNKSGYGGRVYSYDEVMANPKAIKPKLIWNEELLVSTGTPENPKVYLKDNNGNIYQKPTAKGLLHPPAPDETFDNTNAPILRECPDAQYYWELYCQCANDMNATPEQANKAGGYYDGKDYLETQMMSGTNDYTTYNDDGSFTDHVATPEAAPKEPYQFTKNLELISGEQVVPFISPWAFQHAFLVGQNFPEATTGGKALGFLVPLLGPAQIKDIIDNKEGRISGQDIEQNVKDALQWVEKEIFPFANSTTGIKHLEGLLDSRLAWMGAAERKDFRKWMYEFSKGGRQYIEANDMAVKKESRYRKAGGDVISGEDMMVVVHRTAKEGESFTDEIYAANPFDQNRPYNEGRYFYTYDNNTLHTGLPLRTLAVHGKKAEIFDGLASELLRSLGLQTHKKEWYIQWRWELVTKDIYGLTRTYGHLIVIKKIADEDGIYASPGQEQEYKLPNYYSRSGRWQEGREKLTSGVMIAGKVDLEGSFLRQYQTYHGFDKEAERNKHVTLVGRSDPGSDLPQWAQYSRNSKDYHSDQYDIEQRMTAEERTAAIKEIIKLIAVSEGLDMTMRGVHWAANKAGDNYVGYALAGTYEAAKRAENALLQSRTYKIASKVWDGYIIWKRTMDALSAMKKTTANIVEGWTGLVTAISNLKEHYTELDWEKLNLRNITQLMPNDHIWNIDRQIHSIQLSMSDYLKAHHSMAWGIDKIMDGRYGVMTPLINNATTTLMLAQLEVGENTEKEKEILYKRIKQTRAMGDGPQARAKLSNMTRATHNLMVSREWTVRNKGVEAMSQGLWIVESEANWWLKTRDIYKEHFGLNKEKRRKELLDAMKAAHESKSLLPIIAAYDYPVGHGLKPQWQYKYESIQKEKGE